MYRKLLVASGNKGKIREIKEYLGNLDEMVFFEIIGLSQYPDLPDVEEDGDTFTANALKKARKRAEETGLLTLADDSGLVVDYLEGAPGVFSARYAGENATDEDNNKKLIDELKDIPLDRRTAHFTCVLAVVDPETGEEMVAKGICEGVIELEPQGENGFGYDPLFFVPEYNSTMAQLPLEVKNKISHRAEALKKMKEILKERYRELV